MPVSSFTNSGTTGSDVFEGVELPSDISRVLAGGDANAVLSYIDKTIWRVVYGVSLDNFAGGVVFLETIGSQHQSEFVVLSRVQSVLGLSSSGSDVLFEFTSVADWLKAVAAAIDSVLHLVLEVALDGPLDFESGSGSGFSNNSEVINALGRRRESTLLHELRRLGRLWNIGWAASGISAASLHLINVNLGLALEAVLGVLQQTIHHVIRVGGPSE